MSTVLTLPVEPRLTDRLAWRAQVHGMLEHGADIVIDARACETLDCVDAAVVVSGLVKARRLGRSFTMVPPASNRARRTFDRIGLLLYVPGPE
jgi:anti-anti-sigma regulatory factor